MRPCKKKASIVKKITLHVHILVLKVKFHMVTK